MLCALPLANVVETMRCPPVMSISATPEYVTGVALIRGGTVVVIDLGILLGLESCGLKQQARLVTLRVGQRIVALAVNSVIGVREFDGAAFDEIPPMMRWAHPEVLTAVGALDRELVLVLDGSRVLTEEIMARLED
jgi:purine-binding chemotaxis protein CheW